MKILEKLSEERVVSFELETERAQLLQNEKGTRMFVQEECDGHFLVALSKPEVKQLIDELNELYRTML